MWSNFKTWYSFPAILLVLIIFIFRRSFRCIDKNFEILYQLLQSPQRENSFFSKSIRGYYKGRKVSFFRRYSEGQDAVSFIIEPKNVSDQEGFLFTYPKPTKNTFLMNQQIYFSSRWKMYFFFYNEEEMRAILDELTEAAEKIEGDK